MPRTNNRLSLKERKWLAEYLKTGNATQSVLKVYGTTYETARVYGARLLAKARIKDSLQFWLEKEGISDKKLAVRLAESLDATKLVTSHTEPDKEWADWNARLKGVELVAKLKDYFPKDSDGNNNGVSFNVLINGN